MLVVFIIDCEFLFDDWLFWSFLFDVCFSCKDFFEIEKMVEDGIWGDLCFGYEYEDIRCEVKFVYDEVK